MPITNPKWRGALVPVFLAVQVLLIHAAVGREHPPAPPPLSRFPVEFDRWKRFREDPVAADIAKSALASGVYDRLAVLGLEVRPGQTATALIEEASSTLKEKVELGRFARFEGGFVTSYLHKSDPALPPTLGVLVQLDQDAPEVGQDIAHQVAAMRPRYVTRDEVPEDVLANERRIAEQITRDEGKPEQAIGKIVEGRLNAYFKDVVLTEQASVKDPKQTIKALLAASKVDVKAFARFRVGQA